MLGKSVALTSDAGTPVISDPGSLLVQACLSNRIHLLFILDRYPSHPYSWSECGHFLTDLQWILHNSF